MSSEIYKNMFIFITNIKMREIKIKRQIKMVNANVNEPDMRVYRV
jgi:hypothetical protein